MLDCMNRIGAAAACAGAAPSLAYSVERHLDCGQLLSQIMAGNPVPTFIVDADYVVTIGTRHASGFPGLSPRTWSARASHGVRFTSANDP